MSPDDKSLFLDAVEDVQPLKRCTDIHWLMTDSDVWIKRSTRKQPGICGNKRKEALHGAA